jgi:hypothetical protein
MSLDEAELDVVGIEHVLNRVKKGVVSDLSQTIRVFYNSLELPLSVTIAPLKSTLLLQYLNFMDQLLQEHRPNSCSKSYTHDVEFI